jgi:hypothetical protein
VLALPAGQRADWLIDYLNGVIVAMSRTRSDLTPQQQGAAVLELAKGIALRLRLRLPQSRTVH